MSLMMSCNLSSGNNTVNMVYLDFAKAFDKVDHGVLLHKIKILGITGKLGVWLYHFLTGRSRTQFVRLQGGVGFDSPVISGVPQGTVLDPLLFIILMCDINSGITSSSMVSFADDTRLYYGISIVDDCAILQNDFSSVYEWASDNNMFFNAPKFQYIYFNPHTSLSCNVYTSSSLDIIDNQSDLDRRCTDRIFQFIYYIKSYFINEYDPVCNIPNCYICTDT